MEPRVARNLRSYAMQADKLHPWDIEVPHMRRGRL
jgi:hypothetical protein